MQAKFRAAAAADIGALSDLENSLFLTDRISRSSFRRLVGSPSVVLTVAAFGAAIAGYALVLFRARSRIARLYSLAVAPDFRGLGRELLEKAEASAAARGCRALRLEVREDNRRAINLYERSGYHRFGERPDYYADGATALRFEKDLTSAVETGRRAGTAAA